MTTQLQFDGDLKPLGDITPFLRCGGDEFWRDFEYARILWPDRIKQINLCTQSAHGHGLAYEDEETDEGNAEQLPLFLHVNVYLVDQAYGGPEEGGWWYTYGEPRLSVLALPEEAEYVAYCHEIDPNFSNNGRRPISSVLSQGEYRVRVENHVAEHWPKQTPHYE